MTLIHWPKSSDDHSGAARYYSPGVATDRMKQILKQLSLHSNTQLHNKFEAIWFAVGK